MAMATFALPTTGALHRDGWLQQEFFTILSEAKPATHGTPKARAAELAKRFAQECYRTAPEVADTPLAGNSVAGATRREWMREECATWTLLATLLQDAADAEAYDGATAYGEAVPPPFRASCVSHKLLVRNLLNRNRLLRRLHVILRWLEDALYEDVRYLSTKVDYPRTLRKAKIAKANGTYNPDAESALDLDSRNRGAALEEEDVAEEDRMLAALFHLVRCGRVQEAQELCDQAGQPWRAAALQPHALKHLGSLSEPPSKDRRVPYQRDDTDDTVLQGAVNPFVVKDMYRRLAAGLTLSAHERALCGILAGDLDAVLAVSGTWRECLWAVLRSVMTYKVDAFLVEYLGEEGYRPQWPLPAKMAGVKEDSALVEDGLFELDRHLASRGLKDGHPYFIPLQKAILKLFTSQYEMHCPPALDAVMAAAADPAGDAWPARFACHLALTLEVAYGGSAPTEAFAAARQKYVLEYLGHQQRGEHFPRIAFYTTLVPAAVRDRSFPEHRVLGFPELMARAQELDMRQGEGVTTRRERLLEAAQAAQLDVVDLITATVQAARTRYRQWLDDPTTVGLPTQPLGRMLEQDWAHIEALQWLTLREGQRLQAVVQFNESLRAFIAADKFQAAATTAELLPKDTISVCDALLQEPGLVPDPRPYRAGMREYLCWEVFLAAVRGATQWHNHWATRPHRPVPSAVSQAFGSITREVRSQFEDHEWEQRYTQWEDREHALRAQALAALWAVLSFPKGWLHDDPHGSGTASRQEELRSLRRKCVPHAAALLVDLVRETDEAALAVDVLAALASEPEGGRPALYNDFDPVALQKLVGHLAVLLLEHHQRPADHMTDAVDVDAVDP